jgi:hypothetical protein
MLEPDVRGCQAEFTRTEGAHKEIDGGIKTGIIEDFLIK